MRTLRGRLSGLCQPTYVLDIPGGHGKSPVGPNYVERVGSNGDAHVVEDYNGRRHRYPGLVPDADHVQKSGRNGKAGKADEHDGYNRVPHEGRVAP
jgi:hypothetical protein